MWGWSRRERLRSLEARLQALSPRAVLDRGYAIVHGPDGVVSRADRVSDGTDLDVELAAGRLQVRVTGGGSRP